MVQGTSDLQVRGRRVSQEDREVAEEEEKISEKLGCGKQEKCFKKKELNISSAEKLGEHQDVPRDVWEATETDQSRSIAAVGREAMVRRAE